MKLRELDALGIYTYSQGDLPAIIFRDTEAGVIESLYRYSEVEIETLCKKYKIDFSELWVIVVATRYRGVHTLMIDLPTYLAAKQTKELT